MKNFKAYKKSLTVEEFHEILLHLPYYCTNYCPAWKHCGGWWKAPTLDFGEFCFKQFKEWANAEYSPAKSGLEVGKI